MANAQAPSCKEAKHNQHLTEFWLHVASPMAVGRRKYTATPLQISHLRRWRARSLGKGDRTIVHGRRRAGRERELAIDVLPRTRDAKSIDKHMRFQRKRACKHDEESHHSGLMRSLAPVKNAIAEYMYTRKSPCTM
jgi:hypothetical protein